MKRIGWSFLICWVCLACNQDKSQEENASGQRAATTGSISGLVSYKDDKKTLPDVGTTVYAVSTNISNNTVTPADKFKNRYFKTAVDVDGNYIFNNLPADTYTLVFQSKNAPRELSYYKVRYAPVLEPLVSDMPVNNLDGKQAKKARVDDLFKDQQVQVKPDVKLEGGLMQIVMQEFIK